MEAERHETNGHDASAGGASRLHKATEERKAGAGFGTGNRFDDLIGKIHRHKMPSDADFSQLLHHLISSGAQEGRETTGPTPERILRVKKVRAALALALTSEMLEHGVDKANDVITLSAVVEFIDDVDAMLVPGFSSSVALALLSR